MNSQGVNERRMGNLGVIETTSISFMHFEICIYISFIFSVPCDFIVKR